MTIANSDRARLEHIDEALNKIEIHIPADRESYDSDELTRIYLIYHLQVIGEATSRLSDEFCDAHPEVPWSNIAGMRNVLIHNYM